MILILEDLFDGGIGHTFIATDDALIEFVAYSVSIPVKEHLCCKGKTGILWIETAYLVREFLREHRDHTIRQIDTGPTVTGLFVQGRIPGHVIAHISNVNPQHDLTV